MICFLCCQRATIRLLIFTPDFRRPRLIFRRCFTFFLPICDTPLRLTLSRRSICRAAVTPMPARAYAVLLRARCRFMPRMRYIDTRPCGAKQRVRERARGRRR